MQSARLIKLTLLGTLASMLAMAAAEAQTIRFWTSETQPARTARQEALAADFQAKTGIEVEVIPVEEKDVGTRVTAAFAAGDLPDVIMHSVQWLLPWMDSRILDPEAATEVIGELGQNTFAAGALEMASVEGDFVSVPIDGWTQMIVYRKDLFEQNGLAAPTTFANITAAVEALHNPPGMFGFVAATKVDETYMMQLIEHISLANGYSPVNDDGSVNIDEGRLGEILTFYKTIAEASPPGELYWKQSRELYFGGQAAMIIWSPFIMDELAGLRDAAPVTAFDDPTSRELANRTGFITTFAGPSNPDGAAWADIRYFGITADADTDAAVEFVKFAVSEGYGQILGIAPEGKFPIRRGDASDPNKFQDLWASLPVGVDRKAPLADIYSADVIDNIVAGHGRPLGRQERPARQCVQSHRQPGPQSHRPSLHRWRALRRRGDRGNQERTGEPPVEVPPPRRGRPRAAPFFLSAPLCDRRRPHGDRNPCG